MSDAAARREAGTPRASRWVLVLPLLAAIAGVSCSKATTTATEERSPMSDVAQVAPDDETTFTDLPGIEGFDALPPQLQAVVAARANKARCECGCLGHSVNACLHQPETCDIAKSMAAGFVADASALAAEEPAEALAAASGTTGTSGGASGVASGAASGVSGATGGTGASGVTGPSGVGGDSGVTGSSGVTGGPDATGATGTSASGVTGTTGAPGPSSQPAPGSTGASGGQ